MAPLPDNLTGRLYVEYTSGGVEHTALLRLEATATAVDAAALYGLFTTAAKGLMSTSDHFTGARWSAAGSNVSFPLAVSPVTGTASFTPDPDGIANFVGVSGRSLDGRDASVKLFTSYIDPSATGYRYETPTGAAGTFLAFFTANSEELVSASNGNVVWNAYVNAGFHAYWQRQARKL